VCEVNVCIQKPFFAPGEQAAYREGVVEVVALHSDGYEVQFPNGVCEKGVEALYPLSDPKWGKDQQVMYQGLKLTVVDVTRSVVPRYDLERDNGVILHGVEEPFLSE
jgi:hypothetical protein